MKKIELEFQENGIKKAIELFNSILEESSFDLNQFVQYQCKRQVIHFEASYDI